MKTKLFKLSLLLTAFAMLTLSSCKKEDTSTDDSISAEDESNVSANLNAASDDATNAVAGIQTLSGKTDAAAALCGATIDSSNKANGVIIVTFTGSDCSGKISRSGSITATLVDYASGKRWKDAGAVLNLTFNAVTITSNISQKSVVLNGAHTHTNVSGGLAWKLMNGIETGTVSHHHTASNFSVTYENGTTRTWSVDRTRNFNNNGTTQTITISSDHTEGGVNNTDAWGTNRYGNAFTNQITTPLVSSTRCGMRYPTQGEVAHRVGNRSVAIQFGVNSTGAAYNGTCSDLYGFKVTHTRNGNLRTRVVQYWQ